MTEPKERTGTKKTATARKRAASAPARTSEKRRPETAQDDLPPSALVTPEERRRMIAERAYLKAVGRGFQGGSPVQDWLEAEAEVDGLLMPPVGDVCG